MARGGVSNATPDRAVGACVAGMFRTFDITSEHIWRTMILPIREDVDVFFALDTRIDLYLHAQRLPAGFRSLGRRATPAAISHSVARFQPVNVTIMHSERIEHPLAVCFESIRLHEEQRSSTTGVPLEYRWLLRLRPDVWYDRPLPSYSAWPAYGAQVRLVLSNSATSQLWWGAGACIKDQWNLATRAAAPFLFSPCWGGSQKARPLTLPPDALIRADDACRKDMRFSLNSSTWLQRSIASDRAACAQQCAHNLRCAHYLHNRYGHCYLFGTRVTLLPEARLHESWACQLYPRLSRYASLEGGFHNCSCLHPLYYDKPRCFLSVTNAFQPDPATCALGGQNECRLGCSLHRNMVHVGIVELGLVMVRMGDNVSHLERSFIFNVSSGAMAFRARFFCGRVPSLSADSYALMSAAGVPHTLPRFGTVYECSVFGPAAPSISI